MASIYQVNPNLLIEEVAKELKKLPSMSAPEWAQFVKTGQHKQRAPVDADWWYIRSAAILRSVFILGPIGVSKLRTKYGGKKNNGAAPEHFVKGSGNIIRTALQQLETEGLVTSKKNDSKKGRIITAKGQSLLDKCAVKVLPKSDVKKPKAEKAEKAAAEKAEKTE
jgi:small subunit ribosomal protein S19e